MMASAISEFRRVTVMAQVSKTVMPKLVETGQVFDQKLVIFAFDDYGNLCLLSSAMHYWWAITYGSTMKTDLSYSLADVFLTYPRPGLAREMSDLGKQLEGDRARMMLSRKAGLTKIYNLLHNPQCSDSDIVDLRDIHEKIDHAVVRAYDWKDISLDHGFHETRQGNRFTISPVAQQEILDRLLELNHELHAAEIAAGPCKNDPDNEGVLF